MREPDAPTKEENTMELHGALLNGHLVGAPHETDAAHADSAALEGAGVVWKVYAALTLALVAFLVAVAAMASGLIPTPHM